MHCSSIVSACRRELNSHEAAEPRTRGHALRRILHHKRAQTHDTRSICHSKLSLLSIGADANYKAPLCHTAAPNCVGTPGFQSVRRAAATSIGGSTAVLPRRLEYLARHGGQRGARTFWLQATRNNQTLAQAIASAHRALPNPSVEARPNGRPPGPVWRYAYIFTSPGLASCRRRPLSSNVRLHKHSPPWPLLPRR